MTARVTVYGLPHCSTCRKSLEYLRERGIPVDRFHDLKSQPLTEEEIARLAERVGGVRALFSRRARKYREMGLHERELDDAEMLRLMAREHTFITRPVIVAAGGGVAGFAPRRIDSLIS